MSATLISNYTMTLVAALLLAALNALPAASKSQEPEKSPVAGDVNTCDAIPIAEAHYSFGTAVALDGTVLLTEFNHREIKRWNRTHGSTDVWRANSAWVQSDAKIGRRSKKTICWMQSGNSWLSLATDAAVYGAGSGTYQFQTAQSETVKLNAKELSR